MKIRKTLLTLAGLITFSVTGWCGTAPAATPTQPPAPVAAPAPLEGAVPAQPSPDFNNSIPYTGLTEPFPCMGRGLVNIVSCWLEIPRCVVYDNAALPGIGILLGIPEGAFFTVARAGSGSTDLVTFGLIGGAIHGNNFPDFITEARWLPRSK